MAANSDVARWAVLSDDEVYRYELGRRWAAGPLLPWVMLNPSTADAHQDDPTIRRCMGFARAWDYAGITVMNVFALRATDPRELIDHPAPIGPDNLRRLAGLSTEPAVVCAWGSRCPPSDAIRAREALNERGEPRLCCLGKTKAGDPRHPLYVAASTPLEGWPS